MQQKQQLRQDIRFSDTTGGTDNLDITVVHPLTGPRVRSTIENLLAALAKALCESILTHADYIARSGPLAKLLPLNLSTLGGWNPDAHRYLETITEEAASQLKLLGHFTRAIHFQASRILIGAPQRTLSDQRIGVPRLVTGSLQTYGPYAQVP